MNKLETAEAIKVMQAWIDGEGIEFSPKKEDGVAWRLHNADQNVWNWEDYRYRIKPRELWIYGNSEDVWVNGIPCEEDIEKCGLVKYVEAL